MAETTERTVARPPVKRRGGSPIDRIRPTTQQREREAPFSERVLAPLIERLTDQSSVLMRNIKLDDVRYRLMCAGFPRGLTAQKFVFIKFVLAVVGCFVLPFYLYMLADLTGYHVVTFLNMLDSWVSAVGLHLSDGVRIFLEGVFYFGVFVLGAIYGFKMPDIWLAAVTRRRQFAIQMALPDVIDLIAVSVEAGLGLYAAIQRVSLRFQNPLCEEFTRTMQEIRLGRTRVDAMRDMAKRVDLTDLSTFITALVQAELLGLAVANVLRVQSERLREKRSQRAREQAQKAPIKMLVPLVLFIFPAIFVVILGPALIRVLATHV